MVQFDNSWTGRTRIVGDLERPDHHLLGPEERCYFLGEYTARAGFAHSATNQLISNLKKKPSTRHTAQWQHKLNAIRDAAATIRANFHPERLPQVTFVPIPPSKLPNHAEYDNRMTLVARSVRPGGDVREMLVTTQERQPRHLGNDARDPAELRATLGINEALLAPTPTEIFLLDDVLTTGCSYCVCRDMLQEVFPGVPISGFFVARRVPERPAVDDLFEDFAGL